MGPPGIRVSGLAAARVHTRCRTGERIWEAAMAVREVGFGLPEAANGLVVLAEPGMHEAQHVLRQSQIHGIAGLGSHLQSPPRITRQNGGSRKRPGGTPTRIAQ